MGPETRHPHNIVGLWREIASPQLHRTPRDLGRLKTLVNFIFYTAAILFLTNSTLGLLVQYQ
jgi:hypothetical protein